MKKLLVATSNPGKKREILSVLRNIENQIQILTLNDFDNIEEPEETGSTFEENAELKARYYAKKTGLATLSDDGGIMIDVLNGEPGVQSRRWPGYRATDKELIEFTLKKLSYFDDSKRSAKLETVTCFYNPESKKIYFSKENIEGRIAQKPYSNIPAGYPYRSLFVLSKYNKYYDELTLNEHEKINHRIKAVKNIMPHIKAELLPSKI
jgi:XTP/dITP diphosphohydrolase